MKHLILAGALLAISTALTAPAAAQSTARADPQITVIGVGMVSQQPDIAVIQFDVRGEGKTSDDAARSLAATMNSVTQGVGGVLGGDATLQTHDLVLQAVRGPVARLMRIPTNPD